MTAPEDLLERIRLRLEDSFVGIGEVVAELPPADLADLVNQLRLQEAASVMTMLAVPRAVEVFDQPTLERRSAILEHMEPGRAGQILEGLSADQRTDIVRPMGERERRRLLPKVSAAVAAEANAFTRCLSAILRARLVATSYTPVNSTTPALASSAYKRACWLPKAPVPSTATFTFDDMTRG